MATILNIEPSLADELLRQPWYVESQRDRTRFEQNPETTLGMLAGYELSKRREDGDAGDLLYGEKL